MLVEWVIVDQVEDGEMTMTEDVSDPVTKNNYNIFRMCRVLFAHNYFYAT